jgi:hypothetical protein
MFDPGEDHLLPASDVADAQPGTRGGSSIASILRRSCRRIIRSGRFQKLPGGYVVRDKPADWRWSTSRQGERGRGAAGQGVDDGRDIARLRSCLGIQTPPIQFRWSCPVRPAVDSGRIVKPTQRARTGRSGLFRSASMTGFSIRRWIEKSATRKSGRAQRNQAMRRRDFMTGITVGLALPLATHAQQRERIRRVGLLTGLSNNDRLGRNLVATVQSPPIQD